MKARKHLNVIINDEFVIATWSLATNRTDAWRRFRVGTATRQPIAELKMEGWRSERVRVTPDPPRKDGYELETRLVKKTERDQG